MASNGNYLVAAATAAQLVLGAGRASAQDVRPTAQQIVDRIKANVGIPWNPRTVDTFKAGDPNTPVTGIATTMMATLDVLQRAAASGHNLIITHEPTFYTHEDATTDLEKDRDPVYLAKQTFIREHHLVVWRFHDHWHQRNPDGIRVGVLRALGWEKFTNATNANVFDLPEMTLAALADTLKERLDVRAMRVIGDSGARIRRVGLSEGYGSPTNNRHLMQFNGVDVLIIGEQREWETIEYADDAIMAKQQKGLIVLGHIPSEQPGMEECARWLKTFIKDAPVDFVPTREPFWVPR
jgi:putative NIF3 family GTP cyclohydrolase 1 type 2